MGPAGRSWPPRSRKRFLLVLAIAVVALVVAGPIPAYTQDSGQIVRGVAVYRQNCAVCHGVSLNGAGGPSLLAAGFEDRYPTADSLFDQIQTTMPQTVPSSITNEQYWDRRTPPEPCCHRHRS